MSCLYVVLSLDCFALWITANRLLDSNSKLVRMGGLAGYGLKKIQSSVRVRVRIRVRVRHDTLGVGTSYRHDTLRVQRYMVRVSLG